MTGFGPRAGVVLLYKGEVEEVLTNKTQRAELLEEESHPRKGTFYRGTALHRPWRNVRVQGRVRR